MIDYCFTIGWLLWWYSHHVRNFPREAENTKRDVHVTQPLKRRIYSLKFAAYTNEKTAIRGAFLSGILSCALVLKSSPSWPRTVQLPMQSVTPLCLVQDCKNLSCPAETQTVLIGKTNRGALLKVCSALIRRFIFSTRFVLCIWRRSIRTRVVFLQSSFCKRLLLRVECVTTYIWTIKFQSFAEFKADVSGIINVELCSA